MPMYCMGIGGECLGIEKLIVSFISRFFCTPDLGRVGNVIEAVTYC